jgi:hypothetical protein
VVLQGLTVAQDLNGLKGTVRSFDDAAGRYAVTVEPPHGTRQVKHANVRPARPEELRPPSGS